MSTQQYFSLCVSLKGLAWTFFKTVLCILKTFPPHKFVDNNFEQESGSESEAEDSGSEESGSEKVTLNYSHD